MNAINEVDLAFVVDTTGSMGGFIAAAQRQMIGMIAEVSRAADVSIRVAVVQYRDHPPQDTLVYRVAPFSADLSRAKQAIEALHAGGGGDGPEAVLDGIVAACGELEWQPHSRRLAVLVGDAPPHGTGGAGDAFPHGCPCGETVESATAKAEEARVTVYALGLTLWATESFTRIARFTGGECFGAGQGADAVERVKQLLSTEFGHLELDRAVLEAWNATDMFSTDAAAMKLGRTCGEVAASVARLSARRLIGSRAPAAACETCT